MVVEGLSKRYFIGHENTSRNLRETIVGGFTGPLKRAGKALRGDIHAATGLTEEFWALKDVSFEVATGEILGVIGPNGAGKTTLLKVLSGITEPTAGRAEIRGRVGALLEVGTGFHPELTGRENVFLNGAILGMSKVDIERRFDEIVEFSGVSKFLETPVKHYSSGMYVRLAFAVAAHLEPEILIVDEVLAVGDAAFQAKCLGKMGEITQEGRTVLFVSHSMASVMALCTRAILIQQGHTTASGPPRDVIQTYLQSSSSRGAAKFDEQTPRIGTGQARFTSARILDAEGTPTGSIQMATPFQVDLRFECFEALRHPGFGVVIRGPLGERIAQLTTRETFGELPAVAEGGSVTLAIDRLDVLPGTYYLSFGISLQREQIDFIEDALEIEVTAKDVYPTGKLPRTGAGGMIYVPCSWTHSYS